MSDMTFSRTDGSHSRTAKMDFETACCIRQAATPIRKAGVPNQKLYDGLALMFGVSSSAIRDIVTGKRWASEQ